MSKLPTVYVKIRDILQKEERLILILDYEYTINEKEKEEKDLRINFGAIENGTAENEAHPQTFKQLIEQIINNPSGDYTIQRDLDASEYETSETSMANVKFTGTLDGNGYTIKNLNKPLFNSLDGATIKNIKFSNVRLPGKNAQGTLANTANNSNINNILIDDFVKTGSGPNSGTLLGEITNTTIDGCRVTNFNLTNAWLERPIGGLVGVLNTSTVRNSYIIGSMNISWNETGGFVGRVNGASVLENNISKINLHNQASNNCQGFAFGNAQLILRNNVNLNTCTGDVKGKFVNSYNKQESKNNYQLVAEGETFTQDGVIAITKDQVNRELFGKDKANFDENIWNLKNVSYDSTPTLNTEKTSVINLDEVGDEYDENKETLYSNLSLLMPFYDSNKIVKSAVNIKEDNLLYSQEIKHIVPIDGTGNIVTYLTNNEPGKIKKIKIIFKNNEKVEYDVRYDNSYDMVASYRISDLKIDYTYNHYVIDTNSQLVNNLTNYLSELTYADNLDKLTPTIADSRLYSEYYNEVTKNELKEFVLKYLANSNYTNTINDEIIDDYLETEIKKDQKLEKLLYVYNYFKRFYSVDIDGIMLNDFILFGSQGFNENMNPYDITVQFLSNGANIELNRTNDTYERLFSKYTSLKTIPEFLEHLVTILSDKKVDRWYAEQFKGYLVEVDVDGREDIMYTLWDHIKNKDTNTNVAWYNYCLPIITLPKDAAYIISTPTQFIIGAQRTYIADPSNPEQRAKLLKKIDSYVERMESYYETAAKILEDKKYFNDIHTIQIDKRYTYDMNGNQIFQNPYTTQEPFHKNFNEVIGQWAYNDYNAATANGAYIIWRVEGLMDGNLIPEEGTVYEYTFHTWSHETAHNIDARLFLKNNIRRFDAGGEDYADGNLTQSFGPGDIVMNLSVKYPENSEIAANLTPERIDSPDKIKDFYEKLFQTVYIMDYLEGRALLNLTPEEQEKLVVQVSYPNENLYEIDSDKPYYRNYMTTVYQTISKEKIADMKLAKISDLYDNKLVMYPGIIYSTIIDNRYGGENIYKARWYQPHNDYGRPDSYSLKWFAYEMLGYAGYENGYIEYNSNIHSTPKTFASVNSDGSYALNDKGEKKTQNVNYKTDLMALRTITNNESMTFKQYKNNRFEEVEKDLKYIQYIDVNEVYNRFITALREDAEYVKEVEEDAKKRYPTDNDSDVKNRNNMISKARAFEKSTALRKEIYYTIKNATHDFVDEVYDYNNPTNITELTVNVE